MSRQNKIAWLIIAVIAAVAVCFTVQFDNVRRDNMADNTTPLATDYAGVREYIGARYVPVFADPTEWSNTRGYEPLTIVLHEGNSFTSTQFVPTGADINDTRYWAETGNWNAQIEAYRKEVLAFDGRITEVETELATKPICLCIGDSFGGANEAPESWTKQIRDINPYYQFYNYCLGGSGWTDLHLPQTFLDQLKTAAADPAFNNDDVEYIAILGGLNDEGNNVHPAMDKVYNYIAATFPNFKIVCYGANNAIPNVKNMTWKTKLEGDVRYWQQYPKTVAEDLSFICCYQNMVGADNIHPTSFGARMYAKAMGTLLQGCYAGDCMPRFNIDPRILGAKTFDGNPNWTFSGRTMQVNGTVQGHTIRLNFNLADGVAIPIPDDMIDPAAGGYAVGVCPGNHMNIEDTIGYYMNRTFYKYNAGETGVAGYNMYFTIERPI